MSDISNSADDRGEIRVARFFAGVQPERLFQAYITPSELAEFFAPAGLSVDVDSVVSEPVPFSYAPAITRYDSVDIRV